MSRRNIEQLLKRIREELRAEGPDGAGYSDFLIIDAMNSALEDLSEVYPIRDTVSFVTTSSLGVVQSTYNLPDTTILNIIKVEYDGTMLTLLPMKDYLEKTTTNEGSVTEWVMWGDSITLIGEVETAKTVTLWVTRTPAKLESKNDIPETPSYADEGIISFALSVCYRESRDYDRANYHYGIFLKQKDNLLRRATPQGQRDANAMMGDSYWAPFRQSRSTVTSDTNPGGN